MKIFISIFILLPFAAFSQYDSRTITVYGEAQQEVRPDQAVIYVSFSEFEKVKESELAEREEALAKLLEEWNIPFEHVEVLQMNASRSGYQGSLFSNKIRFAKDFLVEFDQPLKLTEFMIELFKVGAGVVRISELKYNEKEAIKKEVTRLAMENARDKAMIMATSQGDTLGNTISIKEFPAKESYEENYPEMTYREQLNMYGAVSRAVGSSHDSPIGLRKINIEVNVKVVYSLE